VPRVAASPARAYRPSAATRSRLLDAAIRVFAERGYRLGTTREICRRAGVNAAMANYHFGSKDRLYEEALREAFRRRQRRSPVRTDAAPPRTVREARARLREIVEGFAAGLAGRRGSAASMLLLREMTEPSAALDVLVEDFVRPRFEALRDVVRVLSPGAGQREVAWATLSILGQVTQHKSGGPAILRLLGERSYDETLVSELVDRVTAFSERALGLARPPGSGAAS
jgi:AcrR family transcriptional regulator